jgi:rhodanese-related sulfurtransferase
MMLLRKNSEIILVCGAGGQAALTGKTLIDMGILIQMLEQ